MLSLVLALRARRDWIGLIDWFLPAVFLSSPMTWHDMAWHDIAFRF